MKRKTLISIALIMIMLLNCMMPLFVVNAAEGEEIQLNSKLYTAVKNNLTEQGKTFESNDITHTLTLSSTELSSVTELILNESAIYDVTGLEKFTSLKHLELSGNNLSKKSNLSVLNGLTNLTHLDLSTNQLEDVSDISELVNRLKESGTIILSGQTVSMVQTHYVDTQEDSDNDLTAYFELPPILELAGYIKSAWKNVRSTPESDADIAPYLNVDSIPMYVTAGDKKVEVNIAREVGENVYGNYGMAELCIYIHDDATEAANANNTNKASENILNGSRFYVYIVVYRDTTEAITTMDTNLYYAIKEQLTAGQTINKDLASYPYALDSQGNVIYEDFSYTTKTIAGTEYRILTNEKSGDIKYAINPKTGVIFESDGTTVGPRVDTSVEEIVLQSADENGVITSKAGYRVAFTSDETGVQLYVQAYDDAKTFVIWDSDLTNKITSLLLNNKQIRDISGLQYFVGLNSNLNISHNYLSDIEAIYELQAQKDHWQAQLIANYSKWLKDREYGNLTKSTNEITGYMNETKTNMENVSKTFSQVINLLVEVGGIDKSKEKYGEEVQAKVKSINDVLDSVWGKYDDQGNYVPGLMDQINGYTNKDGVYVKGSVEKVNDSVDSIYAYLELLYEAYSKEYKLTTLLADGLNYISADEYEQYVTNTTTTKEAAKGLLEEQIAYLIKLESEGSLSDLDKALISVVHPIDFDSKETDKPLAEYFTKYMENREFTRVGAVARIKEFREIALFSEMASYCLIKRMNSTDVPEGYCFEEEYLEKRIRELDLEYMDSSLEKALLAILVGEEEDLSDEYDLLYNDGELLEVFNTYKDTSHTYKNKDDASITTIINMCTGKYKKLNEISVDYTPVPIDEIKSEVTTAATGKTVDMSLLDEAFASLGSRANMIVKVLHLYEDTISSGKTCRSEQDKLNLYNQLMSLSNKLIHGNVERYVYLPKLKRLDVSYNAYLDNIDRLGELTSLTELDASYCYIADIENVDWAAMTHLRKLCLAYNYISDIRPFSKLTNLRHLDLSKNLLSGELKITEEECYQLFKKMEELNLSGNQLTDINAIVIYLDYISGGYYANYLAREDTVNINLRNQSIIMNIEEPIFLTEYPDTVDIELPKIFTQLMAIDTERTAFGETSQNGRIESEGTYVTLNTRSAGDKKGVVTVLAMSGNDSEVETCVGEGTTATINYTVKARTVSEIIIEPSENIEMLLGENLEFKATVVGENLQYTNVRWSVEGNTSGETTISEDGVLTIGIDEEAEEITVKATSIQDPGVSNTVVVKLPENEEEVSNVIIDPCENVAVNVGGEKEFIATVEGIAEDKSVKWSIVGNTSAYTTISEEGKLTVAVDEKAPTISVIAVSNADPSKSALVKVRIAPEDEDIPEIISVMVTPSEDVQVEKGKTQRFIVTVTGTAEDKSVNWKVTGNTSEETTVLSTGLLRVGADEEAEKLLVTAASNYDSSKKAQVEVKIPGNEKKEITNITVKPSENVIVRVGEEKTFEVEVEGSAEDKSVVWKIEGNTSENTKVSEEGKLTIAADETAENLKLIVTSNFDTSKFVTINVKVAKEGEEIPVITKVTVEPSENVSVKVGEEKAFTATVEGTAEDKSVVWKVEGNTSENTKVSEEGKLTVSADETAESLKVTATSKYDSSKSASVTVKVTKAGEETPKITKVTVEPSENISVKVGEEKTFTAKVEGTAEDKSVVWKVEGNTSENTKVSEEGKLTVAADETAENLVVTATSKYDSSKSASVTVKVTKDDTPDNPPADVKLGYKTKGEYLVDVKAKTPVEDFKKILIGDQEYNVVIKKDGKDITTGNLGTGMFVQVQDKDGKVVKDKNGDLIVYEVIVKGDVNGDGLANSLDSLLIKSHRAETATLKAEAFEAADINNDGKVNAADSRLLLYHRAEVTGYDLNFSK